ncbi:hypothetical protein BSZ35_01250 [Salinibacter sp. 10B]|nr:hypothetical protein BSZ35_01250 [Salinibacter sp. 10B]
MCLVGLLAAGLLVAQSTFAQSTTEPLTLIKHLRTELGSKDDARQERALIDVIALASCQESCTVFLQSAMNRKVRIANESGTGNVVDLDALTPGLLRAYRSGPGDGHKLLALSALINVGNQKALEKLIEEKDAQSADVQRVTNMSLASFYFAKYPDLTERSIRRRSLTLDDVQRAEVLRVRAERRAQKEGGQ